MKMKMRANKEGLCNSNSNHLKKMDTLMKTEMFFCGNDTVYLICSVSCIKFMTQVVVQEVKIQVLHCACERLQKKV